MAHLSENRFVMVCEKCLTAACWHGEFMCEDAETADVILMPVRDLVELGREHSDNWSEETMEALYGEPHPFGFVDEVD